MNLVMELTKLDKKILGLKKESEILQKEAELARIRAKELRQEIASTRGLRGKALAEGSADPFTPKIKKMTEEAEASEDKIFALEGKKKELDGQIPPLESKRREAFVRMVCTWLEGEITGYDIAAQAYVERLKRLSAAYSVLKDQGARQDYARIVGPEAYDLLAQTRVVILKGFNRSAYLRQTYPPEFKIIQSILDEMQKGS